MKQLHNDAQAFAELYPEQAKQLNLTAMQDKDPYVERLLEGVAFLTGQVKQHIEADLPEISATFIEQFWPQMDKVFPSCVIMQFQPNLRQVQQSTIINRNTELLSNMVGSENTVCHFNTTEDLTIQPVHLLEANILQMNSGSRKINLQFQVEPGNDLNQLDFTDFKLYINADDYHLAPLLYAFTDADNQAKVTFPQIPASADQSLARGSIHLANLTDQSMLLSEFGREQLAFHLLHEYFCFRAKYQFVIIEQLNQIKFPKICQSFNIEIETNVDLPSRLQLSAKNVLLNCVPAINLFRTSAEPINLDHQSAEYELLANSQKPTSLKAYAVESIDAINAVTGERTILKPLYDFAQRSDVTGHFATYKKDQNYKLSFGGIDQSAMQRLSIDILAYNGDEPRRFLTENTITETAENISFGKFTNITRPSAVLHPPAMSDRHWHLIKYLSLNLQTIDDANKLRQLLTMFNWSDKADNKKRIAGIKSLQLTPIEKIYHGALRSGNAVTILLDEENYSTLADAYCFSVMLKQFFIEYADINCFIEVRINFVKGHQQWTWSNLSW